MKPLASVVCLLLMLQGSEMNAQDYGGQYAVEGPDGGMSMTLQSNPDGTISGQLVYGSYTYVVSGLIAQGGISGTVSGSDGTMAFGAALQNDQLVFQLYGVNAYGQPDYSTAQTLAFSRVETEDSPHSLSESPTGVRKVRINGIDLSTDDIQALEKRYKTTLPEGRFWYDKISGAWGIENGPTIGFVMSGLEVSGPMPPNISGTGTNIFINGREIHPQDQLALHALLGVTYPGRYWLDASGNLGIEGGAVLVNLAAAANQQSASKSGLTSGMGGTVGVDGSGGVLFYNKSGSGYQTYSN